MRWPAHAEPVKIRSAWVAPVSNWASIVLEKKDLAKHLGKSYTLEAVRFAGTPPMITALANGELEIANLAYSTFPLAVQNANLDDLRVIADEFQDGVAGFHTNEFSVLKDSPIKKVEDLKGKVIATNAIGSAVDIASRAMLKKHGLEDKRDYTIVEAPFPTMKAMLQEKKADLVPAVLPFKFDPRAQADLARAVHQQGRDRHLAVHHLGGAQVVHRQEPRRHGRFHGGHAADRALVHGPEEPRRGHARSRRRSPRRRRSVSAGCSPRRTTTATRTCCRTSTRCSPTSRPTHELGFIKAPLDVKKYTDLSLVAGSGEAPEVSVTPPRRMG